MKLHLGCGKKRLEGFVNVDVIHYDNVDIQMDIKDLSHFKTESVQEIYASHVLEHFKKDNLGKVLTEWGRVLVKGGTLRLSVPDFEKVVKIYNQTKNLNGLQGLLYGGQNYEYNFHHIAFDFNFLGSLLETNGFHHIQRYDWIEFLPVGFDDYSRAYMPHMDFENGELMSLNIICQKK